MSTVLTAFLQVLTSTRAVNVLTLTLYQQPRRAIQPTSPSRSRYFHNKKGWIMDGSSGQMWLFDGPISSGCQVDAITGRHPTAYLIG